MSTDSDSAADSEASVLSSDLGRRLLDLVAKAVAPRPADLARWRAIAPAEWVHAAIRLQDSRRRGRAKFRRAGEMWLDPVGLEQATAEEVARYKSTRFKGQLVVDLCSGIGGDAIALAEGHDVLAVDRDPGMCRRLIWNAGIYGIAERVQAIVGDAERFAISAGTWIHIDPDRRAGESNRRKRAQWVEDYQPGPDALKEICRGARGSAIKLGPASDFDSHFSGKQFEVELISLNGECKEATVWGGEAATCWRRATKLPEGTTWTDRDGDVGRYAPVLSESDWTWIYDPDPTLSRSKLVDTLATANSLGRVAGEIDYLVGPSQVSTPFLAAFEVLDILPLDLKRLKQELARREIGRLEIKVRGAEITPEKLRAQLKLEGSNSATILVFGRNPTRAVLARRAGTP